MLFDRVRHRLRKRGKIPPTLPETQILPDHAFMKTAISPRLSILCLFTLLALTACADRVPLKPEAEGVRVATPEQVKHCRHVGRTIVSVTDTVAGIKRKPQTVAAELERLARNHAPKLGGDTLVPEGPVQKGERSYKVYDCPGE